MSNDTVGPAPMGGLLRPLGTGDSPLEKIILEAENQRRLDQQALLKKIQANRDELLRRKQAIEDDYMPLLELVVNDLIRGKTKPPVFTRNDFRDWRRRWIGLVKDYFHPLKARIKKGEYLGWVNYFTRVQGNNFKGSVESLSNPFPSLLIPPANPSDLQNPSCIKDMPHLWDLTPHTGGRKPTPAVQDRDMFIAREWPKGPKNGRTQYVCRKLDEARYPPPEAWEIKKWSKARLDPKIRPRVDSLISKAVYAYGSGRAYRNSKSCSK